MFFVFFFKQKTAYEMRISDWSSDVCSSDLNDQPDVRGFEPRRHQRFLRRRSGERAGRLVGFGDMAKADARALDDPFVAGIDALGELGVRHPLARQGGTGALQDRAPRHAASSWRKLARSSVTRSEEHTSELQSLMRISYAVICLKKKK